MQAVNHFMGEHARQLVAVAVQRGDQTPVDADIVGGGTGGVEGIVGVDVPAERQGIRRQRVFTADEYVGFCGTHCDHIVIPEPDKSRFFDGLRSAVLDAGNRIEFLDTFVLYLAKKPGG